MAEKEKYIVLHPVRHNTRYHARGTSISLSTVVPKGARESEAARLLRLGSVRKPDVLIEAGPDPILLGPATLAKLTVPELNSYAQSHGYGLPAGLTKDQLLTALETPPAVPLEKQREVRSEIEQSAQAAIEVAQAEATAEREGR